MTVFKHRWQRMVVTLICVTILFCGCFESQEEKLERLIGAGDTAFSQREYKAAVGQWHEAMQIAPEDTYISEKLGHAYLRLAKFREAEQYFRQTVDGRPEAWAAWIEIGKLKVLSLDLRGAVDIRKKLKGSGVNNAQALIYHGDLAMLDNDLGEAELDYRQALSMAPDLPDGMIKLAICLQAQKKDADAADIVDRLTAMDIQHPLVLIQLAHYWNLTDDFDTAESYLKKALELDPADLRLQIRAANFYTAAGQYEKATAILEPILNDASLAISKEYAGLLIWQSRIADAITFIEPLVSAHPNDDALRLMMAKCRLLSGDPLLAASEINAVAEKNPDSPLVHYLLGVAYLAGGYNQLGMQHLTTALTLDTGFSDAELALAAYYYKTGDYEIARQHAQRVAEKEPENFRPHMISGAAYLDQGNLQAARRDFGMATILNPDSVSPIYFGALAAEAAGRTQEALDQYEQILSENPMLVDVAEQYKNLLVQSGQYDQAKRFFEALAAKNPENAYTFHILGELYRSGNEYSRAGESFKRAIAIDRRLMASYLPLIRIYEAEGKPALAIDTLKQAIAVNPAFSDGSLKLAQLYYAGGDRQNALNVLESAYAMNRDDPTIINNLASLCLEDDTRLNRAFDLAQQAYEKSKSDPACADTLGWAYFKKGVFRQAVWYLQEAKTRIETEASRIDSLADNFRKTPHLEALPIVNFHLGMALIKSGKVEQGKETLKSAIALGLDGGNLETAKRELEKGGRN